MSRSICQCARCSNQENDMIYIEIHDEWYCTECQENDRIWYPTHGSAEDRWQHDYINLYYEQKEKEKLKKKLDFYSLENYTKPRF